MPSIPAVGGKGHDDETRRLLVAEADLPGTPHP